jgi:rhodanese-related sulfurtransferase
VDDDRRQQKGIMAIRQFLVLAVVATALALVVNVVSPNRIPLVGDYYEIQVRDGMIVPPSAEPGDPPFIAVDRAQAEYTMGTALFVDSRDKSEFDCGTIPGSVNIPFDYLPDNNLREYIDSALGGVAPDKTIITFCSGEECDLSLHLARNLQAMGYSDVLIFFGGSREWEELGFEMERRVNCDE